MISDRNARPHRRYLVPLLFAGLGALAAVATPRAALAQSATVTVNKILCYTTPGCTSATGISTATTNTPVFYTITIFNTLPTSQTVTVADTLPANFVTTAPSVVCNGTNMSVPAGTTGTFTVPSLTLSSGANTCIVNGIFTAYSTGAVQNTVSVSGSSTATVANSNSVPVNAPSQIATDLSIMKSASVSAGSAPFTVTYTITIKNNGPIDVYLGNVMTVYDQLKLLPSSVPLQATYVGGATCTVIPAGSGDCLAPPGGTTSLVVNSPGLQNFLTWNYPPLSPGKLSNGSSLILTYSVKFSVPPGVACIIQLGADGVGNQAHFALNVPGPNGPQAVPDIGPGNDTTTTLPLSVATGFTNQNPACGFIYLPPSPSLKVTKIQSAPPPGSGPFPWPTTFTYKITITNISPNPITNLVLLDLTGAALGTPPFTSTMNANSCVSSGFLPCAPTPPGPPLPLAGYGATQTMLTANYPGMLAAGASVSLSIDLTYANPNCDSYPAVTQKPVVNAAIVASWTEIIGGNPTPMTGPVGDVVASMMKPPGLCPLQVSKSANVTKIHFVPLPPAPWSVKYQVTFFNPTSSTYTVGTLIDTMRTTTSTSTPYAAALPIHYGYTCSASGGAVGYPVQSAGWPSSLIAAAIVPTTLPQQAVRLIQNTSPVIFPGGSAVTCIVYVQVHQPSPSDPYCSMHGFLENNAILDSSAYYNPNLPWTSGPGQMWAQTSTPLPKCYDPILNKAPSPLGAWTWPGGGPVNFALSILNNGDDPMTAGPVVNDTIVPYLLTTSTPALVPPFASFWTPSPAALNPSRLHITNLPPGQAISTNFAVANTSLHPYPPAPGQICNNVAMAMVPPGPLPGDYYWKHQPVTAHACIPVLKTAPLIVKKAVIAPSGITPPATSSFGVNVNCTLSSSITGPNATLTLTAGGPGATQTVNNIPVGSSCTVTETSLPPPHPDPVCNNWVWTQQGTVPPSPVTIPQSGATTTVVVINKYSCQPVTELRVLKTVSTPPGMNVSIPAFSIGVSCHPSGSSSPTQNYTLSAQPPPNPFAVVTPATIPTGWVCTIAESPPPPITLSSGVTCHWHVTYPLGTTATPPSSQGLQIRNTLTCP